MVGNYKKVDARRGAGDFEAATRNRCQYKESHQIVRGLRERAELRRQGQFIVWLCLLFFALPAAE